MNLESLSSTLIASSFHDVISFNAFCFLFEMFSLFLKCSSRFIILEKRDYEQKIKYQIEKSSFKQLPKDPSKQFEMKVNNWIEKWHSKNILDNKWKSFITPFSSTAGKMYGNVKTHKENNPVRV